MSRLRKFYSGRDYKKALSIEELRRIAKRRVPNFAFEYVEGGAEDERALQRNKEKIESIGLKPNVLVDTSGRYQRTTLLGQEQNSPLVIAPTGLNGLLSHQGDKSLARAAAKAGIPFSLSTLSNMDLEKLAQDLSGRLWMQVYMMNNQEINEDIVQRAATAGYEALVLTVDANIFGYREWDRRNYRVPGKLTLRNIIDVAKHPRWINDVLIPDGVPKFENIMKFMPPEARTTQGGVAFVPKLFDATITWENVKWLREIWKGKLIIKGILNVADAKRAADFGCDGIVISNHGGRQLDCSVAPIEMLAEIKDAVGEDLEVLIDSGFRRGADVVKAIAMGASAVMIGRPTLYGLAAGGEAGVLHALSILTDEIDRALGQLGCCSLDDLDSSMLA